MRPWDAPELVALHRLPSRPPLVGFPDPAAARAATPLSGPIDRDASPWMHRLDGRWAFGLAANPEAEPADWTEVDVPGCWTMQDVGDKPHYTNFGVPFGTPPPSPPADNPTGVYRRAFTVPRAWKHRRVVLHVGGAESMVMVKVDGTLAGVGKDSRLASEFDITHLVRAGHTHELTCVVPKWSDASFLEDQDHWWHGGLTREVFLRSPGPASIADVRVEAGLADDLATGTLNAVVEVEGVAAEGWTVQAELDGARPRVRLRGDVPVKTSPYTFDGPVVRLAAEVPGVKAWSHEAPALHRLVVTLFDPAGAAVESVAVRIGFRRVEIVGRDLLLNGERVFIRGVNRHDFNERTGRTVSDDDMRADAALMKQFGFNAVRTSHYPNDPRFLDACDELGLWVVDEANIETHNEMFTLCNDPRYLSQWVERVSRMVRRDVNHPSVFLWSLGNESGFGTNHEAAAAWVRRFDPTRPLHYEGAVMGDWTRGHSATDVCCPMYPTIDRIVEHAASGVDGRPLIMCEFSHAMGNSNGSLADYWDAIESTPGLQGGFIWEWWDHGLRQRLDDGTERWAYGGDFGDEPNDGTFCCDGVVWPDRAPKPALWEHKALASPVRVSVVGRGSKLRIENRRSFTALDDLRFRWESFDPAGRGALGVPKVGPGESVDVAVPPAAVGAAFVSVVGEPRKATPWAPKGFEACRVQVSLKQPTRKSKPRKGNQAAVDALVERLHSLLAAPIEPCLWRAPTENERIHAGWGVKATQAYQWRELGLHEGVPDGIEWKRTFKADGDWLVVDEEARLPESWTDLPRVGVVLTLPAGFEHVTWVGLGPVETYPDRRRGATVGEWSSTVAGLHVPYVRPQEHGNHEETRALRVGQPLGGVALELDFPTPLATSVSHFTAHDLDAAGHDCELTPRPETFVHIDAAVRGLGTASCGPDVLPQYRVRGGVWRWTWRARVRVTASARGG